MKTSEKNGSPVPVLYTLQRFAGTFAFAVIGLSVIVAVIIAGGGNVTMVLTSLVSGSFQGTYSQAETLIRMCPLLLAGLGIAVAFRSGIWNIGAEGQFLIGALTVTACAPWFVGIPAVIAIPCGLVIGFCSGGVWAWIAAYLRTRRSVQEVISTIMLNFIAIQFVSWAVHGPLRESTGQFPYSDSVPAALMLPRLLPPTRLHLGVIVAIIAVVIVWVLLFRTVLGFHIRSTGSSPEASVHAGISPERTVWKAMFISGGLAGLAGAVQLMGVSHILFEKFSPGYGYTAIAVALLGALHPVGVAFSALLFGALEAGASAIQREAGVSTVLVYVIQGVIILTVALHVAHRRIRKAAVQARGAEEV